MPSTAALRTRRPTGRPSWPLILLAGEPKTGKTHRACEFTGDPRVGKAFMLDLGEGCADEYINVPGADYEIVDHDGTWIDIIEQVEAVRDLARAELAAGRPPVCLIIDSMTTEWATLSAWVDTRARRSKGNRKLLEADPDAEIDVGHMYWNDATSRHNRLMNILRTFPGVVIMTALEGEKTQFGADGKPLKINGQAAPKVARPEGQKRLTADATHWVRLSLDAEPVVVGMRAPGRKNIIPGKDKPEPWPDFTLAKLVFDYMGLSPRAAQVRSVPVLDADQVAPGEEPQPGDPRPDQPAPARRVSPAERAKELAGKLLAAASIEVAGPMQEWITHPGREPIAAGAVAAYVTDHQADELSLSKPDGITLAQLAQAVCEYVVGNHQAVPVNSRSPEPPAQRYGLHDGDVEDAAEPDPLFDRATGRDSAALDVAASRAVRATTRYGAGQPVVTDSADLDDHLQTPAEHGSEMAGAH